MFTEHAGFVRESTRLRADKPIPTGLWGIRELAAVGLCCALFFTVLGGSSLELSADEAKIALTASEPLGPYGQVLGGWDPSLWPGTFGPGRLWGFLEEGRPSAASVRWPAVISAILIGFAVMRHVKNRLGIPAAASVALCWFGGLAVMDRSDSLGLEFLAGLGTTLALIRIIDKGADLLAGAFAAWAFLAGGWPPIACLVLTMVVLGKTSAWGAVRFAIPQIVVVVGYSVWALSTSRPEAFAAALTHPLTKRSDLGLTASLLMLTLPWTPILALRVFRSVRDGGAFESNRTLSSWFQATAACLVAGSIVPGMSAAARIPAILGLSILSGATLDAVLTRWEVLSTAARRSFLALSAATVLLWFCLATFQGIFLGFAVPYYRPIAIILIVLAAVAAFVSGFGAWSRKPLCGLAGLVLVAVGLKLAHWGYYVPEWNYRASQGPWGRAVSQWVPRGTAVHVTTDWPADYVLAIGRPTRRIVDPIMLPEMPGPNPKYILLHESEFEYWPKEKLPLETVAKFQDEWGSGRVLARTVEAPPKVAVK